MEKNDFEKKLFEIFAHFWDFLHFAVVILVRICNNEKSIFTSKKYFFGIQFFFAPPSMYSVSLVLRISLSDSDSAMLSHGF